VWPWPNYAEVARGCYGTGRRSALAGRRGSVISARRSVAPAQLPVLRRTAGAPRARKAVARHCPRARWVPCARTSPGGAGIGPRNSWPADSVDGVHDILRRSRCGCSRWPSGGLPTAATNPGLREQDVNDVRPAQNQLQRDSMTGRGRDRLDRRRTALARPTMAARRSDLASAERGGHPMRRLRYWSAPANGGRGHTVSG